MIDCLRFNNGDNKYKIEAIVVISGKDVSVTIGGGDKYHIGAVAIAVPRPEYKQFKKRTASTSVICVQGHREDELSYNVAKYLSTELDCVVTVSIGIHIDNIEQHEIQLVLNNVNILLNNIVDYLKTIRNAK